MEIILKHLRVDEQFRFLDRLLEPAFVGDDSGFRKQNAIKKIMDEVNEKNI